MQTRYTIAKINIILSINKLLFRLKAETMNDKKRENIEQMVRDLDYSAKVIDELISENERIFRENTEVYRINLELQEKLSKSNIKEFEI